MERRTRVRFAPSPTGPLHMGGVRTALYNYLYAKQNGGDFIIRIEDTDSHRFVPGAEQYIIESLRWCGIIPDEGVDENGNVVEAPSERHPHAPYRQSQRKGIYRKYAEQLVDNGYAYYAFDTQEELEAARAAAEAKGETFIYNQTSRMSLRNSLALSKEETDKLLAETTDWTIRFKMPEDTVVKMDDLIRGHIEVNTNTLDDKVLWKRADELPTYHLANIVDDHLMEITEVIRGEEWLPSLPLHYMLYKAFGWQDSQPRFAHLSLLLKPVGNGKLSKRDGDKLGFPVFPLNWKVQDTGEIYSGYREKGYFPEAFVNLLAMLGWNPGTEQELFTMDELIKAFSLDKVQKAGAKFNPDKAKWFNKEYLLKKSDEELASLLKEYLDSIGYKKEISAENLLSIVHDYKDRVTFISDFTKVATKAIFFKPEEYEANGITAAPVQDKPVDPRAKQYDDSKTAPFVAKDVAKFWNPENCAIAFEALAYTASSVANYTVEAKDQIAETMEGKIAEMGGNLGKVMSCARLVLSGSASGLPVADIMSYIGKEDVAGRVEFAKNKLGE